MKIINLLILCILVGIASYVVSDIEVKEQKEIKEQISAETLKQHNSRQEFKKFKTADDYYAIGNKWRRQKNYRVALANYNKAISLNPFYWKAYEARGNVKDSMGDLRGAKEDYAKSIEIKRKAINAKLNKSYDYLKDDIKEINNKINKEEYLSALKLCQDLIEKNPYYMKLYFIEANIYSKANDNDNLIHCYSKILTLTPQDQEVRYKRAQLYYKLKAFGKALADYKELYKVNKHYKETTYGLLCSLMELNRIEESSNTSLSRIEDFSKVLDDYIASNKNAYVYTKDYNFWNSVLTRYAYNNSYIQDVMNKIKKLHVVK